MTFGGSDSGLSEVRNIKGLRCQSGVKVRIEPQRYFGLSVKMRNQEHRLIRQGCLDVCRTLAPPRPHAEPSRRIKRYQHRTAPLTRIPFDWHTAVPPRFSDDLIYADRRNFYKVEKWSADGQRVVDLVFGSLSSL